MAKKIIYICLCIAFIVVLSGCSPLATLSETELIQIETDIITEYLENKYPEKSFEILDVCCERNTAMFAYEEFTGFVDAQVQDENGEIYIVYTHYNTNKQKAIDSCSDDIQFEEIEKATLKTICETLNIEEISTSNNIRIIHPQSTFKQKFNGDVVELFGNETKNKISLIYAYETATININELSNEQKLVFDNVCENIYMVDVVENTTSLYNLVSNAYISSSRLAIDEYWPILDDYLIYNKTSQSFISDMPNIRQFDKISYISVYGYGEKDNENVDLSAKKNIDLSNWEDSIAKLENYHNVTIENVVPITGQYIAQQELAYYMPQNKIAMIDGLKQYILFTYKNNNYSAYLSGLTQEFKLIEDYIYVDNMQDDTQWFIAVCDMKDQ